MNAIHITIIAIGTLAFLAAAGFAIDMMLERLSTHKCPRCGSRKVTTNPDESIDITAYHCTKCGRTWAEDAENEYPTR